MAITSYPFDNQDTTEAQYSELMKEMADSGVADSSDGIGLKVTANGSGMSATIQPGFAVVRGHGFKSTAVEPLTFGASSASLVRWDVVVLRLDPNTNSIVPAVLPGTPAANFNVAVIPTPTRTLSGIYELVLAQVQIRAGAPTVIAGDVIDRRDLQGTTIGSWTTAQRPIAPRKRKFGYNETTGSWENWTGSAWVDVLQPLTDPGQWAWGGTFYGPWHIPNGSWTRAPGATGFWVAQTGHLYQVSSTYSLLMDNISGPASGQVRASLQAVSDNAGSPSASLGVILNEGWTIPVTAGSPGSIVRTAMSTTLSGLYYATTTGPMWFSTCFATDNILASVHSPFSSPTTFVVDLGKQNAPVNVAHL